MSWPFRFYGAAPADWAEGANAGHALTVCFEEAPSEGALRQLGACWASSTKGTRIDPVSAACSSRVLRLVFGETEQGASGDHLDVQASFLRRAHEISPVHDAVYDNARDGSDAWSAWSLEYGPPAPRPADYAASPAFDSGFRSAYVTPEAPVAPAAPVAPSSSTTRAPAPSADIAARLSTAPSALQSKHKGSHVVGDDDCHLIAKKKGDRHTTLMLVRGSKRTSLAEVVAPGRR